MLVKENETKFIWQYGFGQAATADTCSEITLDCIIDDFSNQPSEKPYWFQLDEGDTLFSITRDPYDIKDILSPDGFEPKMGTIEAQITDAGDVTPGEIPTQVVLNFGYFQINNT